MSYSNYNSYLANRTICCCRSSTSSGNTGATGPQGPAGPTGATGPGWDFVGDLTSAPYTWRQTSYNPWGGYS